MWLRPDVFSEVQEAYFQALGRAIGLAQNFEQNCKFVFGHLDLGQAFEDKRITTREEWRAYSKKLMERMLGAMVKDMRKDPGFTEAEIAAFEAARSARNYLAHESATPALFVPPPSGKRNLAEILKTPPDRAVIERDKAEMLLARVKEEIPQFVKCVEAIAHADSMVSGWSYLIQEKGEHMPTFANTYQDDVVAWVLEPLQIAGIADDPCS